MLSELGKFGASFILATQSLAKLEDLSPTMRDTLLANVGCLAVFQVAGNDARQLVWELGKERVSEDDITSLDVHHCYVRATVGTERMPAFSMMVRKPEDGDAAIAERIRAATTAYTLPAGGLASLTEGDADGEQKVNEYRRMLAEMQGGGQPAGHSPNPQNHQPQRRQRTRKPSEPGGSAQGGDEVSPYRRLLPSGSRTRPRVGMVSDDSLPHRNATAAVAGGDAICRPDGVGLRLRQVQGSVYQAVERLEQDGLAASIPHAAELTPPTRRYCLTAEGLDRLAELNGGTVDELLHCRPVSHQWRRVLLDRLDALAVIYRLASAVAVAARPISLRLFRSGPLDAALLLPGDRTLGVVRQGAAADRTAFAKRLWRLGQGPLPGTVLVLASDEVRLRHARKLLARTPVNAALALERDAALAGADVSVWRPPTGNPVLSLRYVLDRTGAGDELPEEPPLSRTDPPGDLAADARRALPVLLKPAEKRALDLLADWPWLLQKDMADCWASPRPGSPAPSTRWRGWA